DAPSSRQRATIASGSATRALSSTFIRAIADSIAAVPQTLVVVEHAVLADRLSVLRDRTTPHGEFRQALYEAAAIMAVEVARDLPVKEVEIVTPLEATTGVRLRDEVARSEERRVGTE